MDVDPRAGKPTDPAMLENIPRLVTAYYAERPDPSRAEQRVAFGTSGHRGSAFDCAFNEAHILAITQAICLYRREQQIDGPLFLGIDTHALSVSAFASALEVLAANGVDVMIDERDAYTPTPAVSHAIITYNRGRRSGLSDGIVVTPSHNPPRDGGFKYNPPHGGAADPRVTAWIEKAANGMLSSALAEVKRMPFARACQATTTRRHDYRRRYVDDLVHVVDFDVLRGAALDLGVDPLGGAGVSYWGLIAEQYGVAIKTVSDEVDPTFRFMTVDWDGKIRMDPSSPYAMRRLIGLKDRYDVAWACDTDHDRHGIVTRNAGLLSPNAYLAVAASYLVAHRPQWPAHAGIGKTIVSSSMIDRVATRMGRPLLEVPVGFKWFVDGLAAGTLAFAGEESAGATFVRRDGGVWTTDKDGIILGLLSGEMTAATGRDPGELYRDLTRDLGEVVYERIDAPATRDQKAVLAQLSGTAVKTTLLAGDRITAMLTAAPGNGAPIGGLKVTTARGWFAARPSGTEEVYKLYAESFVDRDHLHRIQQEAQAIIQGAFRAAAAD
jgi:phosphoglucomutase